MIKKIILLILFFVLSTSAEDTEKIQYIVRDKADPNKVIFIVTGPHDTPPGVLGEISFTAGGLFNSEYIEVRDDSYEVDQVAKYLQQYNLKLVRYKENNDPYSPPARNVGFSVLELTNAYKKAINIEVDNGDVITGTSMLASVANSPCKIVTGNYWIGGDGLRWNAGVGRVGEGRLYVDNYHSSPFLGFGGSYIKVKDGVQSLYGHIVAKRSVLLKDENDFSTKLLSDALQEIKGTISAIARGYIDLVLIVVPGGGAVDVIVSFSEGVDEIKDGNTLAGLLSFIPAAALAAKGVNRASKFIKFNDNAGNLVGKIKGASAKKLLEFKIAFVKGELKALDFVQKMLPVVRGCDQPMKGLLAKVFCLAKGTPILTDDGLKDIESLSHDDKILTKDEVTGRLEYVNAISPVKSKRSRIINFEITNNSDQNENINCTPGHLFSVSNNESGRFEWKAAEEIKVGDILYGKDELLYVTKKQHILKDTDVYTILLPTNHTYFAGELNVLTHNDNCYKQLREMYLEELGGNLNALNVIENVLKDDDTGDLLRWLLTDAGVVDLSIDAIDDIKDSFRNIRPRIPGGNPFGDAGLHEWLPVSKIEKIIREGQSAEVIQEALEVVRDFRSKTSEVVIYDKVTKNKYVHSFNSVQNETTGWVTGGPIHEMHLDLFDAFDNNWNPVTGLNKTAWKAEVEGIIDSIFPAKLARQFKNDFP